MGQNTMVRSNVGQLTRRRFLGVATAAVASLTVPPTALARRAAAALARDEARLATARTFVSRPDLRPPRVQVTVPPRNGGAGYVFVAPFTIEKPPPADRQYGPLIIDDSGEPIWFQPLQGKVAMSLRVQKYRGQRVLTWWEGQFPEGYGGEFVIVDRAYREVGRVRAKNGLSADLHEFVITSRGSALIMIYDEVAADLTSVGGPPDGRVVDGVVQEIDIASGRLLLEWRSLDHVSLDESFFTNVTEDGNVDYIHLNSIGVDRDGHLLVSARHTSAVYKLHRTTGAVLWRLGGKRSDFDFEPGAAFAYQHDARRHGDGTLTLFDNAAAAPNSEGVASRALRLTLDTGSMTARVARDYQVAGERRIAFAMGNAQQLPGGNLFVGWGTFPSFNEISPTGEVHFDARFAGTDLTYRAYLQGWTGRPASPPATTLQVDPSGNRSLQVSWNGATDVARWRLAAGVSAATMRVVSTVDRAGFETAVAVPPEARFAALTALDPTGRELGRSPVVDLATAAAALQPA